MWNKIISLIALLTIPAIAILAPETNWFVYGFLTIIFISQNLEPIKVFLEYIKQNWKAKYKKNSDGTVEFEFSDEDKKDMQEMQ